jgi:hypothetical protein
MWVSASQPTLERSVEHNRRAVMTMVEWGSNGWGGNVHLAENGSWVTDRHGDDDAGLDD